MATGTILPGESFTVDSASSLIYNGVRYEGVTAITMPDGSVKTCADLLAENGGRTYQQWELKACVKVEGYDPDQNNRQVFTAYSNNSRQVVKNETSSVPGGLWVEMFNFTGDESTNYVIKMWADYFGSLVPPVAHQTQWHPTWLGFRLNYGIYEARTYTMTWVNDFLEESVPCPPTELGVTFMHYPRLYGRYTPPASVTAGGQAHYYVPIRFFRLYRTNATSTGSAVYQRVPVEPKSIAPNQFADTNNPFPRSIPADSPAIWGFEFRDTVASDKLLETLVSTDWSQPPFREMRGLTAWRNGMMACFNGNTVMICEPYRPFAWPRTYWFPLPVDVIALIRDDNALIVLTTGEPYIFNGSHPANVSWEPIEDAQPGVPAAAINGHAVPSKALARTPAGVMYASPEGLVNISGGRARPVGRNLWTREEWQGRYNGHFDRMRLAYADGHVIAYFPDVSVMGFKINVADTEAGLTKYLPERDADFNIHPIAHFQSPRDGKLYLIYPLQTNGSQIKEAFSEQVPRIPALYWTRTIHLAKPENLGALEIRGYGGTVRVEVFDDRSGFAPIYDKTFTLGGLQSPSRGRLPGGRKARNYSVRLTLGRNTVIRELALASTPQELERV